MIRNTVELGWNCGNDDFAEVEELSSRLELSLPENESEGSSIYGSRLRYELAEFGPVVPDWHMTVSDSQVEELLGKIKGFMLAAGRRFSSFEALVFVAEGDHFGSRMVGSLIQEQRITNFTLHEGNWSDEDCRVVGQTESEFSEPVSLESVAVTVYETLFTDFQPVDDSWRSEGF